MDDMVVVLGLLLGSATLLAVILKFLKQSNFIAFIVVGMVAGLYREQVQIPAELLEIFSEIGIIMLLFMAGLEVDIKSFLRRWRLVLINGLGQIVLLMLLGLGLGRFYVGIDSAGTLIFFALCLTLSSTIIVLGMLKERKELESLHGQIVLGLMVIQDVVAVLALSLLKSIAAEAPLLVEIPLVFFKMAVLIAILAFLSKFVLGRVFRYLASSSEMLFIGTLGYCMGIAALCELFHFSAEIGAFFAGASLAFLPYRLEIEDKVEPLKAFGLILFFIALGYNLRFKPEMLGALLDVAVLTAFVVVGTPVIMLFLGWVARLKARPALLIGGTINQISEFSLILATLCFQAGVFDESMFTLITLTCLATFMLSSLGHQYMSQCYEATRALWQFIDRHGIPYQIEGHTDFKFENHVVIVSFNEIAQEIAEYYDERGESVLLIDIDPEIIAHFNSQTGHNLVPLYADIYDPDVWSEFNFDRAKIIISCMVRGQEAELGIARWLREKNADVPMVAATDSHEEALELYENGVRYVIQTEYLAAESFRKIYAEEIGKGGKAFLEIGAAHLTEIRELQLKLKAIFRLI
ncbi:MAG: cation:proton antiporter [SAR324 cluster bacterium]|nr:cation:proton antiporter [SAR324 cluster bacterium]